MVKSVAMSITLSDLPIVTVPEEGCSHFPLPAVSFCARKASPIISRHRMATDGYPFGILLRSPQFPVPSAKLWRDEKLGNWREQPKCHFAVIESR